jgi:hypothetical protein
VRLPGRILASRRICAVLALTLLFTSVAPAYAVTNAKIEARQRDAARAQAKLDELFGRYELSSE